MILQVGQDLLEGVVQAAVMYTQEDWLPNNRKVVNRDAFCGSICDVRRVNRMRERA